MNDVEISYCLTAALGDRAISAAVEQPSPEERARHSQFVSARDRRDFAVAHALLRRALSAKALHAPHEWAFGAAGHDKPRLDPNFSPGTHLLFNLAVLKGSVF